MQHAERNEDRENKTQGRKLLTPLRDRYSTENSARRYAVITAFILRIEVAMVLQAYLIVQLDVIIFRSVFCLFEKCETGDDWFKGISYKEVVRKTSSSSRIQV